MAVGSSMKSFSISQRGGRPRDVPLLLWLRLAPAGRRRSQGKKRLRMVGLLDGGKLPSPGGSGVRMGEGPGVRAATAIRQEQPQAGPDSSLSGAAQACPGQLGLVRGNSKLVCRNSGLPVATRAYLLQHRPVLCRVKVVCCNTTLSWGKLGLFEATWTFLRRGGSNLPQISPLCDDVT